MREVNLRDLLGRDAVQFEADHVNRPVVEHFSGSVQSVEFMTLDVEL
jgi:hypothetical protein